MWAWSISFCISFPLVRSILLFIFILHRLVSSEILYSRKKCNILAPLNCAATTDNSNRVTRQIAQNQSKMGRNVHDDDFNYITVKLSYIYFHKTSVLVECLFQVWARNRKNSLICIICRLWLHCHLSTNAHHRTARYYIK